MKQQIYITNRERKKCRKVVTVFSKYFNRLGIWVLDADKYGFVLLKYCKYSEFDFIETYTDSNALFDALWQEWFTDKLFSMYVHTPLIHLEYQEMYDGLTVKQQNKILKARASFQSKINSKIAEPDTAAARKSNPQNMKQNRYEAIAQIFRKDLGKHDIILKEAGKHGFVMLQYYKPIANFDSLIIFKNSRKMFDTLLNEWYECLIIDLMEKKQVNDIDIDDFYNTLPEKEKNALVNQKNLFEKKAMKKLGML